MVNIWHREVIIDMWDSCTNTIVMKKVIAELELIIKLMSLYLEMKQLYLTKLQRVLRISVQMISFMWILSLQKDVRGMITCLEIKLKKKHHSCLKIH